MKLNWFRILIIALIFVPALLFQTVVPIIDHQTWDEWSEGFFPYTRSFSEPENKKESSVFIINVGLSSIEKYGWPVPREKYVELLEKLKQNGNPWVLSLLRFQKLANQETDSPAQWRINQKSDMLWTRALSSYRKFIGSSVDYIPDSQPSEFQEEKLVPRMVFTKRGMKQEKLPFLPVVFQEHDQYSVAQKAFGLGPRFGTESVINCTQFYVGDWGERAVSIPTSLLWASALFQKRPIELQNGAVWPQKISPRVTAKTLNIAYKECVGYPHMTTSEWLEKRKIKQIGLEEALTQPLPNLDKKIVMLTTDDMRKFRGPGFLEGQNNPIAVEYQLAARFLDELTEGTTIHRSPLDRQGFLNWLPLVIALYFLILSFFIKVKWLAVVSAIVAVAFPLAGAVITSASNMYFIPVQAYASSFLTFIFFAGLHYFLSSYGSRRVIAFSEDLRVGLGQCNHLEDLEERLILICREHFANFEGEFRNYNKDLYQASESPEAALSYIQKNLDQFETKEGPRRNGRPGSIMSRSHHKKGFAKLNTGLNKFVAEMKIMDENFQIGVALTVIFYHSYEETFLRPMLEALKDQISLHWNRIHLLAYEQIKTYEVVAQRTRSNIISKFLSQALVNRFSDARTMDQNFREVLVPRTSKVTILQADIRGFTKLAADKDGLEMVKMLQNYYRDVVDAAQQVAQVKLIGDGIFIFVEEPSDPEASLTSTDIAMFIASKLVTQTFKENSRREDEQPVNFGIAIHYGEAIIGNLSSENCIDYTAMGSNVNKAARIEEVTKNKKINELVGDNGVLLSNEAVENLKRFGIIHFNHLELKELGVAVRSFSDTTFLKYITADGAMNLADHISSQEIKGFKQVA